MGVQPISLFFHLQERISKSHRRIKLLFFNIARNVKSGFLYREKP